MIHDFLRNIGSAVLSLVTIALLLAAACVAGLGTVWLIHRVYDLPEGGDIFVFIVVSTVLLIATALTLEEHCG